MLYKTKTLKGYALDGYDGEIGKVGKVEELYFDDRHWAIRNRVNRRGYWVETPSTKECSH